MVSHALGINLEGNGNEILLTREGGRETGRERGGDGCAAASGIFSESLRFQGRNWALQRPLVGPLFVNSSTKLRKEGL